MNDGVMMHGRYGGMIPRCSPLQRRRIGVLQLFYPLAGTFYSILEMSIYLHKAHMKIDWCNKHRLYL